MVYGDAKFKNLLHDLREREHAPIMMSECPKLPKTGQGTPCWHAGRCLCSAEGKNAERCETVCLQRGESIVTKKVLSEKSL